MLAFSNSVTAASFCLKVPAPLSMPGRASEAAVASNLHLPSARCSSSKQYCQQIQYDDGAVCSTSVTDAQSEVPHSAVHGQAQTALLDVLWGLEEQALPGCAAGLGDLVSRTSPCASSDSEIPGWWHGCTAQVHEVADCWRCSLWRPALRKISCAGRHT